MKSKKLTSLKNQEVKDAVKLKKRKYRTENNEYIIEGVVPVQEAFKAGIEIKKIFVVKELLPIKWLPSSYDGMVYEVTDAIIEKLSDTENAQGIVCVASGKTCSIQDVSTFEKLVFLDGVQDPGNLGTIIRSADALNIDGLLLGVGTVDVYNSKVVRSSMASIARAKIVEGVSYDDLASLKEDGYVLIGADSAKAMPLHCWVPENKTIICLGNEANGISKSLNKLLNNRVYIPMNESVDSLNVGVAAGIIFYHWNTFARHELN